jgi:hypothetical protein
MELSSIIPNKNDNSYIIGDRFLMYRKFVNIPLSYIEDDVVYVFLDKRISKIVIKMVKHLIKNNIKFFLTTPELSNPKGVFDYENKVISHYFYSYVQSDFFYGFNKINFDMIENLVNWTIINNCYDLIKENYNYYLKKIDTHYFDHYQNSKIYSYNEEIREDYKTIFRRIQIYSLLMK